MVASVNARPDGEGSAVGGLVAVLAPHKLGAAAGVGEGVGLVPVGAFVARVFGEELRAPAQDVGAEDRGDCLDDLGVHDVLTEQVDVQVPVVVGDVGVAAVGVGWVDGETSVEQGSADAVPALFHLVFGVDVDRADEALLVERRELVVGERSRCPGGSGSCDASLGCGWVRPRGLDWTACARCPRQRSRGRDRTGSPCPALPRSGWR
jgi:hypothetical protein